jgi:hypothetical protein
MSFAHRGGVFMIRSTVLVFSVFVLTATVMGQSGATAQKPSPELKQFDVLVGKWNIEGQAQASPYGPAGKITEVDTFEWMPGGFFMTHHWDARQGGVEIKGMEVLGYDGKSKVYTSRFFDNLGSTGSWKGTFQANAWTWTGDTEVGGKPLKERCTTVVTSPGALTSKCEFSSDGTKWLPNFEAKGTKAK